MNSGSTKTQTRARVRPQSVPETLVSDFAVTHQEFHSTCNSDFAMIMRGVFVGSDYALRGMVG